MTRRIPAMFFFSTISRQGKVLPMHLKLFIWAWLTLASTSLFGQTRKCDDSVLLTTSKKLGKLNQVQIVSFLSTFGKECADNAEFSEWSNELLFSLLDKQTELTVMTIERAEERIDMDVILYELSAPITDMVNITTLIPRVEKVAINPKLKKQITEQLKTAERDSK